MNTQWYEVVRRDGNIQYATKEEGKGFLLYGSGFFIGELDAVSVTPIDEVPVRFIKGKAYIDGEFGFKAVCNVNNRWNGWAMPHIHRSHIKRIVREFTWEDMQMSLDKKGVLTIKELEYTEQIEPTEIDGELYYYLGGLGWCWDFVSNK